MKNKTTKQIVAMIMITFSVLTAFSLEAHARKWEPKKAYNERQFSDYKKQRESQKERQPRNTEVSPEVLERIVEEAEEEGIDLTAENIELIAELPISDLKAGTHPDYNQDDVEDLYLSDEIALASHNLYNITYSDYTASNIAQGFLRYLNVSPWGKQGVLEEDVPISKINLVTRTDWAGSAFYVVELVVEPLFLGSYKSPDKFIMKMDYTGKYANKSQGEYLLDAEEDEGQEVSIISEPIEVEREIGQDQEPDYISITTSCSGDTGFSGTRCQGKIFKARVYQILY